MHICKRPDDSKRARGTGGLVEQNVFELNPTLLLNNPLLNPIHGHDSNYFAPTPMMSHSSSGSITLRDVRLSLSHFAFRLTRHSGDHLPCTLQAPIIMALRKVYGNNGRGRRLVKHVAIDVSSVSALISSY